MSQANLSSISGQWAYRMSGVGLFFVIFGAFSDGYLDENWSSNPLENTICT